MLDAKVRDRPIAIRHPSSYEGHNWPQCRDLSFRSCGNILCWTKVVEISDSMNEL